MYIIYMYINVPPFSDSVGVDNVLYPFMLLSYVGAIPYLIFVSDIPIMSDL